MTASSRWRSDQPHAWVARVALIACGFVLEAWTLSALPEPLGANLPRHVALGLGAWLVYVVAIRAVLSLDEGPRRLDLILIFALGAGLRLTMLATSPSLSDDVFRTIWDARILHAGINPYGYAPSAPELEWLRDDVIWPRVNHPDQRAPYPPLSEIVGALAYGLTPERPLGVQGLAAAFDLGSAGILALLLRAWGQDPRRAIVLAWSPAGVLHFAHSGHNDAAMIFLVLTAILALTGGRRLLAMATLGLATAVKAVPLLMLPAALRASGVIAVLGWAAAGAAVTLPFVGAGTGLIAGISAETGQRFNDSLFLVVERLASAVTPSHAGAVAGVFGVIVVVCAVGASLRFGDSTPHGTLINGSRVLALYLLVAPVVEPWYFTWLAPLIALRITPSARGFTLNEALAWLWLGGVSLITDMAYTDGGARLWPMIRLVEYAPAYLLLATSVVRNLRAPVPARA